MNKERICEILGKPWYDGQDCTTWQLGPFHYRIGQDGQSVFTCGHTIAVEPNNFRIENPTIEQVVALMAIFGLAGDRDRAGGGVGVGHGNGSRGGTAGK